MLRSMKGLCLRIASIAWARCLTFGTWTLGMSQSGIVSHSEKNHTGLVPSSPDQIQETRLRGG